jgi:hypothetical protein
MKNISGLGIISGMILIGSFASISAVEHGKYKCIAKDGVEVQSYGVVMAQSDADAKEKCTQALKKDGVGLERTTGIVSQEEAKVIKKAKEIYGYGITSSIETQKIANKRK